MGAQQPACGKALCVQQAERLHAFCCRPQNWCVTKACSELPAVIERMQACCMCKLTWHTHSRAQCELWQVLEQPSLTAVKCA